MIRRIDLDDTALRLSNGHLIGRYENGKVSVKFPIRREGNKDLDYLRPAISAVGSLIELEAIYYEKVFGCFFKFYRPDGRSYMTAYNEIIIFDFEYDGEKELVDSFIEILANFYP